MLINISASLDTDMLVVLFTRLSSVLRGHKHRRLLLAVWGVLLCHLCSGGSFLPYLTHLIRQVLGIQIIYLF